MIPVAVFVVHREVAIRRHVARYLCRDIPWDGPWVRAGALVANENDLDLPEELVTEHCGVRYCPLFNAALKDRSAAIRFFNLATDAPFDGGYAELYEEDCMSIVRAWPDGDICLILEHVDSTARRIQLAIIRSYNDTDHDWRLPAPRGGDWDQFKAREPKLYRLVVDGSK